MAVLIKDDEADRLIRELADRTGETIADAVKQAVRDRLDRLPLTPSEIAERRRNVEKTLAFLRTLPTADTRSADEIIGYNEHGHFD